MLDVHIEKDQGAITLDVRFSVRHGGITAVFGSSGAGKTTLINCIAGLIKPDSGRIVCHGLICFDSGAGICLPSERRGMGYVFQDGRLFPHMSVRSNLLFGQRFRPPASTSPRLADVVDLLGISLLLPRYPGTLSGGEKQRVAIGRALLCGSRVLLMDEPLTALDLPRRLELMRYIKRIPASWDISILYVTHSSEELLFLADTVLVLEEGSMRAFGSLSTVAGILPACFPLPSFPLNPGEYDAQDLFAQGPGHTSAQPLFCPA